MRGFAASPHHQQTLSAAGRLDRVWLRASWAGLRGGRPGPVLPSVVRDPLQGQLALLGKPSRRESLPRNLSGLWIARNSPPFPPHTPQAELTRCFVLFSAFSCWTSCDRSAKSRACACPSPPGSSAAPVPSTTWGVRGAWKASVTPGKSRRRAEWEPRSGRSRSSLVSGKERRSEGGGGHEDFPPPTPPTPPTHQSAASGTLRQPARRAAPTCPSLKPISRRVRTSPPTVCKARGAEGSTG